MPIETLIGIAVALLVFVLGCVILLYVEARDRERRLQQGERQLQHLSSQAMDREARLRETEQYVHSLAEQMAYRRNTESINAALEDAIAVGIQIMTEPNPVHARRLARKLIKMLGVARGGPREYPVDRPCDDWEKEGSS